MISRLKSVWEASVSLRALIFLPFSLCLSLSASRSPIQSDLVPSCRWLGIDFVLWRRIASTYIFETLPNHEWSLGNE